MKCKTLDSIRTPYLEEMNKIIQVVTKNSFYGYDHTTQLQIILDCTKIENEIFSNQKKSRILEITADIEYISRRLCFALHSTRYRSLNIKKGKYWLIYMVNATAQLIFDHGDELLLFNIVCKYAEMVNQSSLDRMDF